MRLPIPRRRPGVHEQALSVVKGRFEACLQSPAVATQLRERIDDAAARNVRATPTLFVNGRRHVGAVRPSDLSCLLSVGDRPSKKSELK